MAVIRCVPLRNIKCTQWKMHYSVNNQQADVQAIGDYGRDLISLSKPGRIALKKAFFTKLMTVCHVLV
jgi:hypothetical protein